MIAVTPTRRFLTLPITLLLTACSSTSYNKPGISSEMLEEDRYQCEIEALEKVPPEQKTYTNFATGQVYSVDNNSDLRDKAFGRCMESKGYTLSKD